MIESINIRNVLSFDNTGVKAKLHKINLLIGKNLTGKTNFITAINMSITKDSKNYEVNGREVYNSSTADYNDWLNLRKNALEIHQRCNIKSMFISEMQKFNSEFLDYYFTSDGNLNIIEKSRETILSQTSKSCQYYFTVIAELLKPNSTVAFIELGNFIHKDNFLDILNLVDKVSEEYGKQVFIKTYSRDILDYYSNNPEYLILFEKEKETTKISQFINGELDEDLKKYSLGTIWTMGIIGGNVY